MCKLMRGFSLIELMLVVSIMSILIIAAIPSYQHYVQRARFAEVITATQPYKLAVALALQTGINNNELTLGMHGIPPAPKATKHLASLAIDNGVIVATATELAGNATIILKPNTDGTNWTMSGSCLKSALCTN